MAFGSDINSMLWHMLGGTRGGETRARILIELMDRPFNPNQLSERLNLDYKTVTYHLDKLEENGLLESDEQDYGEMYRFTEVLEENTEVLEKIWEKLDKTGEES